MAKYILKLYVTDGNAAGQNAIKNLKQVLEEEKSIKGKYELEIIDILKHPQLAEDEKIMATPALIKELPEPIRRIIGDLSDKEKILFGLDLVEVKDEEKKISGESKKKI